MVVLLIAVISAELTDDAAGGKAMPDGPTGIAPEEVTASRETPCCVVGSGPGGMVLALLLARRGVPVTLLEAPPDFDRDFRGDTLHPGILEILDQIGLAERLHRLPHVKWFGPSFVTTGGPVPLFDFRRLRTR